MYVPVTIENTTVESTAISSGLGTLTIPANTISVGSTSSGKVSGTLNASNNATITMRLKMTDTNSTVSTIELFHQFPNNVTASSFTIETMYVVTSIVGTVTTINYNTAFRYSLVGNTMGGTLQTSSFQVNSTLALTSNFTIEWGGLPSTSNSWTTTQGNNINVFQP